MRIILPVLKKFVFVMASTVGRSIISLLPIKNGLWIFGAWNGEQYSDNSKYLFEYTCEKHHDINAIWVTRNNDIFHDLKQKGYNVVKRFSIKGIITIGRAEVAFETEGYNDISILTNRKTRTVIMWHGAVSPKKLGWPGFNAGIIGRLRQDSYWITSSKQNSELLKQEFDLDPSHLIITGYPRNDILFRKIESNPIVDELENRCPKSKKIIYMPTHRNFGTRSGGFSTQEFLDVDKRLKELNICMLYKPHFHEFKNLKDAEEEFSNIVLAKDQSKYGDVYSYLGSFDLLISDYSSILYDFLCTKKPVIMFPYDLKSYQASDSGVLDFYSNIPAGPMCYSWNDVVNVLEEFVQDNIENWKETAERARLIFHPFDDGNNCERVYNATRKMITGER